MNTQTTYQHIRNATGKLTYGGKTFLIDPFFAPKESQDGYEGTFNSQVRMPLVDLPCSIEEIVSNVDAVIITHIHPDHWDQLAAQSIPKDLPIFLQNQADAKIISTQGFTDIRLLLHDTVDFHGIKLHQTGGAHGTLAMYAIPQLSAMLGDAMGIIFQAPELPSIYFIGDTIWTQDVEKAIHAYQPDYLVMNTGYARLLGFEESITMGVEDVARATRRLPNSKIITVHMDTVNHTAVSRKDMKKFVDGEGLSEQVIIPQDGESIRL